MKKETKLKELLQKLEEKEKQYKDKLSRFRGVPHESSSGELAYSDLKVLEDYIGSLKKEIADLKKDLVG